MNPRSWLLVGLVVLGTSRVVVAEDPKPKPLSGRVVDKNGAGVAGVVVWAVGEKGPGGDPAVIEQTATGPDGRFSLKSKPAAAGEMARPRPGSQPGFDIVARARDGRLAWTGRYNLQNQGNAEPRLTLAEPATLRGRLVDQEGKPIAGVEITPLSINAQDAGGTGWVGATLTPELARSFRAVTGPDGRFAIAGFPKVSYLQARLSTKDLGTFETGWDPGEGDTLSLDRHVGKLAGRLKLPGQARLSGSSSITLSRINRPARQGGSRNSLSVQLSTPVAPDGGFWFEAVQPGQYLLRLELDPAAPFLPAPGQQQQIRVEPGATVEAPEIPLEPLVAITGRVLDGETEKGLEGVWVTGYAMAPRGGMTTQFPPALTDREGRYRLRGIRGRVAVNLSDVPRLYVAPDFSWRTTHQVSGDTTWEDLRLSRGLVIDGLVVDAAGRPVPGAEILVVGPINRSMRLRDGLKSGPDGTFRLEQLPPGSIAIRARVQEQGATSRGAIVVRPQEVKGTLKITVDPKLAFRMRGNVTDRLGKPVPGAQVTLQWMRQVPSDDPRSSGSIGTSLPPLPTDAAGRFDSGPLFPGDQYQLNVTAEGHAPFLSSQIVGTPGMTRGLGRIRLAGTSGHLAGTVIDSAGKPVAGATVFNRGNALQPVETRTDVQGRFRLEKLFPGHKYAFARKEGFRFTVVLAEGDRDDLTIRLLRADEPPPAWKPSASPATPDEQRELARRILTRLWENFQRRDDNPEKQRILSTLAPPMARIDPALALEWSSQIGGQTDTAVKLTAAEVLADLDAGAAIQAIRNAGSNLWVLLGFATWYAETDPARALTFTNEAAGQVRTLGKQAPITCRARLGELLLRLGQQDEGKKLIEEAVADVKPPAPGPANAPVAMEGLVPAARALALYDVKRALALVERPQQDFTRALSRAALAASVASSDSARAVELVKDVAGQRQQQIYIALIEVVYRCGAVDPDQALKIVELMQDNQARGYKPQALGWLAVAVARRDPKRAFALIDKALDQAADEDSLRMYYGPSGGTETAAARVALCARRIGYPDMESVLARVLAARRMSARSPRGLGAPSSAAALLSLLDPGLARELLLQAEEGVGSMPMPEPRPEDRDRRVRFAPRPQVDLIARVLAGGVEGQKAVDDALAEVDRDQGINPQVYSLTQLATVLSSSPARREEMLWGERYDSWYPGRMPYNE
jgi:protocatechuate 3,4-dioxygenase beta subunit